MKNVKLLYWLNSSYYSWFWLGVWVLYYSKFGGFTAVGILETVMIVSTIVFEIPTGAIGDLLGKRKTLFLGYFLSGLANIWMGLAPNLSHMILTLILMNFGGTLRSGTFEATIYDSLKDEGKEKQYHKVLSRMTALRLVTLSIAGIIGGFLYKFNPQLPFVLTGIIILLSSFVALWIKEPIIDSEKFTIKSYIKQNIRGFRQLFLTLQRSKVTISLLLVGVVSLIMHEGINDILGVKYGFTEVQLGILAAILGLAGAFSSIMFERLERKTNSNWMYLGGIAIYALSLVVSPYIGLYFGGFTILIRNIVSPLLENKTSSLLNEFIESKYRATALSSFSMLQGIPYALSIYWISAAADVYPAQKIAFWIGCFLLITLYFSVKVFGKVTLASQD